MRLGTASMVQVGEGPFINLARLNVAKYAAQQNIAKALFEYIYFHENDVRHVSSLVIPLESLFIVNFLVFYTCLFYLLIHKVVQCKTLRRAKNTVHYLFNVIIGLHLNIV